MPSLSICRGGSTPKTLYSLLASEAYRGKIEWPRLHVFFGDERFVPWDHADSNYRMAREAMLLKVPIPEENVHPVQTSAASPDAAAADYETTLKHFYGRSTLDPARPLFAVTLLGLGEGRPYGISFPRNGGAERETEMGDGGHRRQTGTAYHDDLSRARFERGHDLPGRRGCEAAILKRILAGDPDLPASHVRPQGEFRVFCDKAANGEM